MNRLGLILLTLTAVLVGCQAAPRDAAPVIEDTQRYNAALAQNDVVAFGVMRQMVSASLDARRELVLGQIEAEFALAGYEDDNALDNFTANLTNPSVQDALVNQVRIGIWDETTGGRWVQDYANARRLITPTGVALATSLLGELQPIQMHDTAAVALLEAVDRWAQATFERWAENTENARALAEFANAEYNRVDFNVLLNDPMWLGVWSEFGDDELRTSAITLLRGLFE
jgi:hypothetical protein